MMITIMIFLLVVLNPVSSGKNVVSFKGEIRCGDGVKPADFIDVSIFDVNYKHHTINPGIILAYGKIRANKKGIFKFNLSYRENDQINDIEPHFRVSNLVQACMYNDSCPWYIHASDLCGLSVDHVIIMQEIGTQNGMKVKGKYAMNINWTLPQLFPQQANLILDERMRVSKGNTVDIWHCARYPFCMSKRNGINVTYIKSNI